MSFKQKCTSFLIDKHKKYHYNNFSIFFLIFFEVIHTFSFLPIVMYLHGVEKHILILAWYSGVSLFWKCRCHREGAGGAHERPPATGKFSKTVSKTGPSDAF